MTRYLVTGDAGFIGFHLSYRLLKEGHEVLGIDGLTPYYDPQLKKDRLEILSRYETYSHLTTMLEDLRAHRDELVNFAPEVIVHLAAQAGVRYSIENPDAYISANVEGTLRVLELARDTRPKHLMIASTSSVYGGREDTPFSELGATRTPVSLYAATKIATEALAHSFSHLWSLPTTAFRFFTVYGPWGRPDMALFKFVNAIRSGQPIDVYGHGAMARDFTYVADLVSTISALVERVPVMGKPVAEFDTSSPVAPYRVVNAGGGNPVPLLDFIQAVEDATATKALKEFMPMQPGDVVTTSSDTKLLRALLGFVPETPVDKGVHEFVEWYDNYYTLPSRGERN